MIKMMVLSPKKMILGLAFFAAVVNAQQWGSTPLQVGDELCIEGYVMDFFCINRGRLLDPSGVPTLGADGPVRHTVHCLVDVQQCVDSEFEILLPTPAADLASGATTDAFIRGWRLAEDTKKQVVTLARREGSQAAGCTTCTDTEGTLEAGFHVGMNVVVTNVGDAGTPPTVELIQTTGWSDAGVLTATEPNSMTPHCATGSAYPPNIMTQRPTEAPTTAMPTLAPVVPGGNNQEAELQAFSTSLTVAVDRVELDFVVDPQAKAVTITMTLQEEEPRWMAIGASPLNSMVGSTACIYRNDVENTPKLFNLGGYVKSAIEELPEEQQTLISASHVVQDGVNILTCKVPLDLTGENQFAFSTNSASPMVVAWGSSETFGQHAVSDRVRNLSVPPLQPKADDGDSVPGVGDTVCVEGYVMDFFCINRNTLFDNNSIRTLSPDGGPEHSVHCLIDVSDCISSAFEILIPPLVAGDDNVRGWRLDEDTKSKVVALAKAEGICSDCDGGGTIRKGFHVTFTAEILDQGTAETPPTIKATGAISTNSPNDLKCEGGTARPPPFVPEDDDELAEDEVLDGLVFQVTDNGDNTATYVATYDGEAWVAIGVSTNGLMVGAQAVIGLPDSTEPPQIYNLNQRALAGVVPAPADQQILIDPSVTQENGVTVLTFTVPLETEGFFVSANGVTGYLAARGTSNALGTHGDRIPFESDLRGGLSVADDPTKQYKAHGILMAIAWGVLCPLAIGASMLRGFFPPGMFFQIHRALNSLVVLFTLIAFSLAVKATNIEGLDHFSEETHRRMGLVIFLFSLLQATNGLLRPHAPGEGEEKAQIRFVWEIAHRVLGLLTLFMAWSNCNTGLERYFLKFDNGSDDENTLRAVFWAFAAGLTGVIVIAKAGVTAMSSGDGEAEPKSEPKEDKEEGA